jgi:hypothetical protein
VAGQTIRGTIWYEPTADALIQVELTVAAALYGNDNQPQQGDLKITLKTQQAKGMTVTLPSGPAAT